MKREARTEKILMLGVDGMDPCLTRKYVDMGLMPYTKKYIEAGAQRHDLTMLGGHPTVTPPMWTTLATGCYSNVHGITGFFRNGSEIGSASYNCDSRLCKAEQLWNCFAEAGKKTLVWHWPGAAWPPSSDSENLYVVDGTTPGSVSMGVSTVGYDFLVGAAEGIKELRYMPKAICEAIAACVIEGLEVSEDEGVEWNAGAETVTLIWKPSQHTTARTEAPIDLLQSPVREATGWADAPADAKEFVLLLGDGTLRRPCLILKNEQGIYDTVAIYKNKKETVPNAVCPLGKLITNIHDEARIGDIKFDDVIRSIKLLKIAEDGSSLTMYVSAPMNTTNAEVWHPTRIFDDVVKNVGYPTPVGNKGLQDPMIITECVLPTWEDNANWQADSILHLIKSEGLEVVFSHFHSIDLQSHLFIKHLAAHEYNRLPHEAYVKFMEDIYVQLDNYLGKFIHLLDEDWTILIFSDHAQVSSKHDIPLLMDINGVCTPIFEELGYTATFKDEKGNVTGIDWANTRAIIQREGHIYLNIKGRNKHTLEDGTVIDGIVDPEDQYELEEQIMTDLYGYKDKKTGHRIVSVALRNRDAVLLGQGGPEAGDICCWLAEGYNFDHADSLSTFIGEGDTSVSPIFIAAGKGLKKGYETDRIIRQIDFVPTVAILGGVRMPAQCEGAPAYQIFEEEV